MGNEEQVHNPVAYPGFGVGGCLIIIIIHINHTYYLLTTPEIIIIITVQSKFKQSFA